MKTVQNKYEYLYSGMEGSYWIDCKILSENKGKYKIEYEHPFWEKNYFEQETTKDRIRVRGKR